MFLMGDGGVFTFGFGLIGMNSLEDRESLGFLV
jgi:hypothetical protein